MLRTLRRPASRWWVAPLRSASTSSTRMAPAIVSVKEAASTNWLRLNTITYVDAVGKQRFWDVCERTTRRPEATADAVVIFCRLLQAGRPTETLLVRQFRPPMGSDTIELPAGLLDPGEDAATAALRELKEETGYTAKVVSVSPTACMSPGLTNETVHLVHADIDLDDPVNASPKQHDDDAGSIAVLRVPLTELGQQLQQFSDSGCHVFMGLWTLVAGLSVGGR